MQTELKPCPFCGEPPELCEWLKGWSIDCLNDNCLVHPDTPIFGMRGEAIEAWNKRVGER